MPHDLAAERAVLGGVLLDNRGLAAVLELQLQARHFYRDAHGMIFDAMLELFAASSPIDSITLRDSLASAERLTKVGGDEYLLSLTDQIPTIENVRAHAQIVIEKAERRHFFHSLTVAQVAVLDEDRALNDARDIARDAVDTSERSRAPAIVSLGPAQIFAPLPESRWVAAGLQIGPGRPAVIAGYGSSAKTLAAQSLALCVAAGVRVWGHFDVEAQRVLHLDYEQGFAASAKRYQRLALGHDIEAHQLQDRLRLAALPSVYLDSPNAAEVYMRACDGFGLVVIDSLKAAAPMSDENDSSMRRNLDMLTKISERTACAFLMILHSGKPKEGGNGDARTLTRGSSAIFDACGSMLLIETKTDGTRRVQQIKQPADAEGPGFEPFAIAVEDIGILDRPKAGVRISYEPIAKETPTQRARETYERDANVLLDYLRKAPGASSNQVVANSGMGKQRCLACLAAMTDSGLVEQREGANRSKTYWVRAL